MASKKGFWTLTKVVKITYTQEDDCEGDEAVGIRKAKERAYEVLDEAMDNSDGLTVKEIKGNGWEVVDFEEEDE